ncbi:two-component sensor histidine kinase [Sphaerisporangium krabiense]|uniref:Two-component system sensor histidine kinase DesK n=1 Tax=Sphaerisporangium krabiense TaxID=763782 RepID=A0A7W8Z7F2_9ACTN|nr:histidine kinase [Sphaerisporangium krabiense]MBB5628730.1 two-component system sensor histidine kinase DesK [Sphaerisporangium krabiense]GII60431.1 two-component sensor histidine kinase [Sphaerisporangium krabiense]
MRDEAEIVRASGAPSARLYGGMRLFTVAFLLLILSLWPDFAARSPAPVQWFAAAAGVLVFGASYVRVVFSSIPRSRRVRTPWAFAALMASGFALLAVLPYNWIYYLPFYLLTCLVITQRPTTGLLSAAGCVLVVIFVGMARGTTPVRLGMLALQLGVFALTMTGIHQLIDFTVTQWETQKAAERVATERERRRLSRDLHDLVGRDLVALVMRAEVVAQEQSGEPVEAHLRHIAALARTTLNNTLAVVEEMRAPDVAAELDDARELLVWAGIDLAVFGGPTQVHRRAPFAWFLREAVTNVVKHSGAQTCRVIFGPDRLTVEDDGRPRGPLVPGAGLTGLRERLEQAGGELLVEASPDGGVRVIARLVKGG